MNRRELQLAEKAYIKLLRVYPKPFRMEYGSEMAQLFRDQLREARLAGRWSLVVLWLRVFADLFRTAVVEHLSELTTIIKLSWNQLTFTRLFLVSFLLLMCCFLVKTAVMPKQHSVAAMLVVEDLSTHSNSYLRGKLLASQIKQDANLDPVIAQLNLLQEFRTLKSRETPVSVMEARSTLRNMLVAEAIEEVSVPVSLRRTSSNPAHHNSTVDLTVLCPDEALAKRIADCIGDQFVIRFSAGHSGVRLPSVGNSADLVHLDPEVRILRMNHANPQDNHPSANVFAKALTSGFWISLGMSLLMTFLVWFGRRGMLGRMA